jgi:hypothetical protein
VATQAYSGLLTCRNGQGVPISFSIEESAASDAAASKAPGSGK